MQIGTFKASRKSMGVKINMVVIYTDNLDCYHYFTVNEIENVFH